MQQSDKLEPLLGAKLHCPQLPKDYVYRRALLSKLHEGIGQTLTLICAPAGYGKSSLAGEWLKTSEQPSCWLSLDQSDSDLSVFLRYTIEALQQALPGFGSSLLTRIKSGNLPPVSSLSTSFSNELEGFKQRTILALDDYHLIQDAQVNEFVNRLVEHPSDRLHLAIITRRNPSLPLSTLRANYQISEIRMADLQFSEAETTEFLERFSNKRLDAPLVAQVHNITEGWAAGLRLAALALRHQVDLSGQVQQFGGDLFEVQRYLMCEVLNAQSDQEQEWLCKTAILDQFTAELCEHLCRPSTGTFLSALSGEEFIDKLHNGDLFCISLDHRREWNRYHHQFQRLLTDQLKLRHNLEEIQALHLKAANWLLDRGEIERALEQYLQGGEHTLAVDAIVNNYRDAFSREEAYRVRHWLKIIGEVAVDEPRMLLVQAWIEQKNTRYAELTEILSQLDAILKSNRKYTGEEVQSMHGECETLRSMLAYWNTDAKSAIAHAEKALELLPGTNAARGFTIVQKIGALHMLGDARGATAYARSLLEQKEYRQGTIHGRLLQGLCYAHSFSGDIPSLLRTCAALHKHGHQNRLAESIEYAQYFRGIASYQLNDMPEARFQLEPIISNRNLANYHIYTSSVCAMCYVLMAMGEGDKALAMAEPLVEDSLNSGATGSIDMAQACLADLALRRNRIVEAVRWADSFEIDTPKATTRFIMPELVYLKIRMAQNTPDSRPEVAALFELLQAFLETIHNVRFLAELHALRALALLREDKRDEALAAIEVAVDLAREGEYIRIFVDLGPELAPLLNQLKLSEKDLEYVGRILSAYPAASPGSSKNVAANSAPTNAGDADATLNILSSREHEILLLLAQRMENKEIAVNLFISPATVKRHAQNIYEKLGVHSRREAVAKATGLGLIQSR